ncbi:hypothetical protein L484_009533 [Morus notabilis]|uniref:Uncharacterized protein n=1 Tax=Morus notabilis TaxID=981085 RepID=W9R496_9ROSA|nr:hypothetical protein L484_009533 [Morus notabilis]
MSENLRSLRFLGAGPKNSCLRRGNATLSILTMLCRCSPSYAWKSQRDTKFGKMWRLFSGSSANPEKYNHRIKTKYCKKGGGNEFTCKSKNFILTN